MSNEKIKVNYGEFHPCKTKADADVLFNVISQALRENEQLTLRVAGKDGMTTFGITTADFFDCPYYMAGLAYSVCVKAFDCETEEDDMIIWLLNDIESAVGEDFSIALFSGLKTDFED